MNPALRHWLPALAFVAALGAAMPRLLPANAPHFAQGQVEARRAVSPAPTMGRREQAIPIGAAGLVGRPQGGTLQTRLLANPQPSAHAAALAELPAEQGGRIAAAWFAGSAEGARDVAIHFATFDGRQWSTPIVAMTRERTQRDTGRLVRKLGNPVIAADPAGKLHLWYVSVGYGGWAGSSINHSVSDDGGKTWGRAEKLVTSPFWNLSTLVRTPPLPLADGGWGLPVYHEFAAKHAEWLRLDAAGRVRDKVRLPGSQRSLQPAVAALDASRAVAMMRDAGPANRIRVSATADGGRTWDGTRASALPNPNAAVALLRLAGGSNEGRLLLAYNPQTANRDQLALAVSSDAGVTWSAPKLVEDSAGGEFSYPTLLQGRDGTVHLAYTWQRKTIKHLAFAPEWIEP